MFFAISLVLAAVLLLLKIVGAAAAVSWWAIIALPVVCYLITFFLTVVAVSLGAIKVRR